MDLYQQNVNILDEFQLEFQNIIKESNFIGGQRVENFERDFSKYVGTRYCIGTGNGTDALEIALLSLELSQGSEVIVPRNSFIATAEAVKNVGLEVCWVDFDDTYNIDPEDLKEKINKNTSAIIFVHLYGNPSNIEKVQKICLDSKIPLIEDCAQAHGAMFKDKMAGAFGNLSAFSFYPGKNLGAFGDAGAILTDDAYLSDRVRMIANHGRKEKYYHEIIGRNSRLDSLQAVCLSLKLKHLNLWNEARRKNAEFYIKRLDNSRITLSEIDVHSKHVFHHFVIKTENVKLLKNYLKDRAIPYGQHYPYLLPDMPSFGGLGDVEQNVLSIPVHESLSKEDLKYVLDALNKYDS